MKFRTSKNNADDASHPTSHRCVNSWHFQKIKLLLTMPEGGGDAPAGMQYTLTEEETG